MKGESGNAQDGSDISSEGSPLEFMATEGARFAQLHASPTGTKETIEAAIPRPRNRLKELITSVAASPSERAHAEALLDRHKGRAKLLRADPKAVKEIQESYRPTVWSTDIGLWPRTCALLFQPQISASAPMKLQLYRRYDKDVRLEHKVQAGFCLLAVAVLDRDESAHVVELVDHDDRGPSLRADRDGTLYARSRGFNLA
jgi:hypothetical protein